MIWDIFKTLIQISWLVFDVTILAMVVYYLFFQLIGIFLPIKRLKPSKVLDEKLNKFCLIICAHNEENVLVNSLIHIVKLP
jgi:hypothetical protein